MITTQSAPYPYPTVVIKEDVNESSENRITIHDLPTPEKQLVIGDTIKSVSFIIVPLSPTITSLTK